MYKYKFSPIKTLCPICHSKKAHILYSVDSDQAAHLIFNKKKNNLQFNELKSQIESLWQGYLCDFIQCDECRFCYANPFISGNAAFYTLAYGMEAKYQSWKWDFQITYQTIQKMVGPGIQKSTYLLEIGAGNGTFARKVATSLLAKENILCIEYSEYGMNAINAEGIKCLSQDVREMDLDQFGGKFDIVCMFHVLEHMDQLDVLFEHLTKVTTEKASMFVAVPNFKQREFYDLHGIIEDVPPTHIGRWNWRCFEIIGKRHGWMVTGYEIEPQTFISKAYRFVSFRFTRSKLSSWLDQIHMRALRRIVKLICFGFYTLISLPVIISLNSSDLGVSQWVHLKKGLDGK